MLYAFDWSADATTFLISKLTSHETKLGSNDASSPPSIMNARYTRNLFDLVPTLHCMNSLYLEWPYHCQQIGNCYIGGLVSNCGLPCSLCQTGRYNVTDAVLAWNTFPEATMLFTTFRDLLPSRNFVDGVPKFWMNLLPLSSGWYMFVNCSAVDTRWQ
jgi:hypothetical protein